MVRDYHVETGQDEASSLPICVEFKHLRRSGRVVPTKRTYEKMQGTSNRTGRLVKKPKLAVNSLVTDAMFTNGASKEPATDESTSETPNETSTNPSATSTPATGEPPIDKSYIDSPNTIEAPKSPGTADLPTSATHIQIEGGEIISASPEDDIFPMTLDDGLTILDEYFERSVSGRVVRMTQKGLINSQHSRPSLSIKMGLSNPQFSPILQEP
jgi:hypothetical protein